ncbi:MAG: hypothetical protein H6502_04495 [Candidatus Woesearchaeota archaeon]|nr:MAG: hypothetical protein H6502_04495 [Candidatus Woesearchaeota archaeon]
MTEVANVVQSEVRLAVTALPAYEREFYLPQLIEGFAYNVSLEQDLIVVEIPVLDLTYVRFMQNATPYTISVGFNRFTKEA